MEVDILHTVLTDVQKGVNIVTAPKFKITLQYNNMVVKYDRCIELNNNYNSYVSCE